MLDQARGRLYTIGSDGLLHALSLATGEEASGWPLRIVQHTGAEYVWGGLTLRGNRVYVPVASFCDKPDQDGFVADGRLVAVDGSTLASSPRSTSPKGRTTWAASGAMQASRSTRTRAICGRRPATASSSTRNAAAVSSRRRGTPRPCSNWTLISTSSPGTGPRTSPSSRTAASALRRCSSSRPAARRSLPPTRRTARRTSGRGRISAPGRSGARASARASSAPRSSPSRATHPSSACSFISAARDYDEQGAIRTFDAVVGFKVGPRCELPERPTWTAPGVGRGPKSPPLIVDDLVFVPGGFDRNAFALDARTGEVLWTVGLPGAVAGADLVCGGRGARRRLGRQPPCLRASSGRRCRQTRALRYVA